MKPNNETLGDESNKCTDCGAPTDNGEGWDGLCGNCADKKENAKVRPVEVARAWAGSDGDSGEWDTYFYDIPIDTPEDKIEEVALGVARTTIAESQNTLYALQHLWIYSIPDIDDDLEEAFT